MMQCSTRAILVALCATAAACGGADSDNSDPTGPNGSKAAVVAITGAEAPAFGHGRDNGAWRMQCVEPLTATATGGPNAVATWEGATFSWLRYDNQAVFTADTLSADEVATFWGSPTVPVDSARDASQIFWGSMPFHARLEFRYRDGVSKATKTVTFTFRCEPPAPPLEGEWILSSISGRRLPAYNVVADTLAFLPNVTYTVSGQRGPGTGATRRSDPEPYRILSATEYALGTLIGGLGNVRATRVGPTTFTVSIPADFAGRYVWRFDLRGSNPVLPPEPKLASSVTSLSITAKSGGPIPPPVDFMITSTGASAGNEIPDLSAGIRSEPCANSPCLFNLLAVSGESAFTPMKAHLVVRTTSVPPGTYRGSVAVVQDEDDRYDPILIPVTYTVTP